uniref:G_PROTEIN_RECEP_F1_2 domain-containing protein n=1 Tax=Caenorhabditis tropicalis TaxID=1561998 RepID=A0A1I7TRR7_9PELO
MNTALPTYRLLSFGQLLEQSFAVLFPVPLFVFDVVLLAATISNRRDTTIPVAYIVLMAIRGMLTTSCLSMQHFIYVITTADQYQSEFTQNLFLKVCLSRFPGYTRSGEHFVGHVFLPQCIEHQHNYEY